MSQPTENEKRTLSQKFLEFQRMGLESYGKYLADQLEQATDNPSKVAYAAYVRDQLEMNEKKIEEINGKLK